jgi:pimeloyl-ACP methyl ester carboxylesterase
VLHGLNVNPQRMAPLVQELNAAGVATLRCSLFGHGANYVLAPGLSSSEARLAALGRTSFGLWCDEAAAAYRVAAQQAVRLGNIPVVLVAFSLGGLIGCTAALRCQDVRFARMILLAPALCIHRRSYVLRLFARWPQRVVRSFTPPDYRANPGTSIAAYTALYTAQAEFMCKVGPALNVPTLVFIDPHDEMVSAAGLQRLIVGQELTRWQLYPVYKGAGATTRYHHLLIDSASVSPPVWAEMMARIGSILPS